jgi:hypothetical protein
MKKIGPKVDSWGKVSRERDIQERNIYDHLRELYCCHERNVTCNQNLHSVFINYNNNYEIIVS